MDARKKAPRRRRRRSHPSRRIAAIGLLGTGLYASGLSAVAGAQTVAEITPAPTTLPAATPPGDAAEAQPPAPAPPETDATPTPDPPADPAPVPEPPADPAPAPEPPAGNPAPAPGPSEAPPASAATAAPTAPSIATAPPATAARSSTAPAMPKRDLGARSRAADHGEVTAKPHHRQERPAAGRARESRARDANEHRTGHKDPEKTTTSSAAPSPVSTEPAASPAVSGVTTPTMWPATGVPSVSVESHRIPQFLLSIYRQAGSRFGVPWEVLAAINEIETDYGRNAGVSSAGAVGWMQFLPSTWKTYGVDANADGVADPNNPIDAIFAAARYLRAAGAEQDLRRAIFAYNHAEWYVDAVLLGAGQIAAWPGDLVAPVTDVADGRFPVTGRSTYVGGPTGARVFARAGAPVLAVKDGRIVSAGRSDRLGRFLRLKDGHGNVYTYAGLGRLRRRVKPPGTTKLRLHGHRADGVRLTELRPGARVAAGTVLGNTSATGSAHPPHLMFQIRPAGRATPIDPERILTNWKLRQAAGDPPPSGADRLSHVSDHAIAARVLEDRRIDVYACGRQDIQAGRIDRRVLATLEHLAASGLHPTVSALQCGHSLMTTSGNISEHSSGDAVDISAINGTPIAGHQGPGSITDIVIRRLLDLQGAMRPHQIISLMQFPGASNTLAMSDHADHIHVGWRALESPIGVPPARAGVPVDQLGGSASTRPEGPR
jgi:murein DD-endopeptidase MepM/ murein hydrolase activator NlpD